MNHLSQRTYICLTVVSNSLFPATSSKCRSQFSRDPLLWIMYRILLGSCRGMEALCQKSWLIAEYLDNVTWQDIRCCHVHIITFSHQIHVPNVTILFPFSHAMLCKRGLCRHAVSVRPSVCPSVVFVDSVETDERLRFFFHRRIATPF